MANKKAATKKQPATKAAKKSIRKKVVRKTATKKPTTKVALKKTLTNATARGAVTPIVTTRQIDAILPFLDKFDAKGFSAGTWNSPKGQLPWFAFSKSVSKFHKALYDNGWITPFNWTEWQETVQKYVDSPATIESTDVETIQKLFTTHVRADRFCEGHLAEMFENGHIVALLRRLRELRRSMGN